MDKENQYWKCEYENLRRKKNKQIAKLRYNQSVFFDKTWKLLKGIGLSDKEIREYYDRTN